MKYDFIRVYQSFNMGLVIFARIAEHAKFSARMPVEVIMQRCRAFALVTLDVQSQKCREIKYRLQENIDQACPGNGGEH